VKERDAPQQARGTLAMSESLAFDLYGTLVDPTSHADLLARYVDDPAGLAVCWRRHQLEVSWLLSLMGRYEDWENVTRYALQAALDETQVELTGAELRELQDRSKVPRLYDDVVDALEELRTAGHELTIFSNSTLALLETIADQTGIRRFFSALISVDAVGVFKPAPAVYAHAAAVLDRPIGKVWLVSGNPFDAAGAKAAGMRVVKLERQHSIRYAFAAPPDLVVSSLRELPSALTEPSS
jgi:2-haloacid dehalogenase